MSAIPPAYVIMPDEPRSINSRSGNSITTINGNNSPVAVSSGGLTRVASSPSSMHQASSPVSSSSSPTTQPLLTPAQQQHYQHERPSHNTHSRSDSNGYPRITHPHPHPHHDADDSHSMSGQSFTGPNTPRLLNPWDMSEPGGRTLYLPGPEAEHTDIFATATNTAPEQQALLLPTAVDEAYVSTGQPSDAPSPPSLLPSYIPPPTPTPHKKLSQWFATAICGNDITSSCFYVTGICVANAGIYAPICMLLVAATLYLFRNIYGESVTALPLNGGAYNVLLNTTSKSTAAMAACLTILSYMATGVVSAASAIAYLSYIWPGIPTTLGVIVLLAFFALLCLWGITESADVALFIFTLHMLTLFALVAVTLIWCITNGFPELTTYHLLLQIPTGFMDSSLVLHQLC